MVRQAICLPSTSGQSPRPYSARSSRIGCKAGLASAWHVFAAYHGVTGSPGTSFPGTPMPQGPSDLSAQLAFLCPQTRSGCPVSIRERAPRDVLGQLYVRTTKSELGIPPVHRHFYLVDMADGQKALYGIVRSETLRQLRDVIGHGGGELDVLRATIRDAIVTALLQSGLGFAGHCGVLRGIELRNCRPGSNRGTVSQNAAVEAHTRQLAHASRKVVIWTIFTETLSRTGANACRSQSGNALWGNSEWQ